MELTTNLWMLMGGLLICLVVGFFLGGYILRLKFRAEQSAVEAREEQLGKNLEQIGRAHV